MAKSKVEVKAKVQMVEGGYKAVVWTERDGKQEKVHSCSGFGKAEAIAWAKAEMKVIGQ